MENSPFQVCKNKRKKIADQTDSVKRRRMEVDTSIQSLTKDMNKCLDKGQASHDMAMFLKANGFKKTVSEKKATVSNLDEAIKKLEEDYKTK